MAVEIIVDASVLISLCRAEALDVVLKLSAVRLMVGPIVEGEAKPSCGDLLATAAAMDLLEIIDETEANANTFLGLLARFRLGDGETECLTLALGRKAAVATDDLAARRAARDLLGPEAVSGSLGLLKRAVEERIVSVQGAFTIYRRMIETGSFLPTIEIDYFGSIS